MVITPNYLGFDCIILRGKKEEMNYEDINTTVSFSVLRCFRSKGYLLLIIAHERMYLLAQKKAAHKTKHMSRPVFSCVYTDF